MSNEEILELISGLDYMGNIPTVPSLGSKPSRTSKRLQDILQNPEDLVSLSQQKEYLEPRKL